MPVTEAQLMPRGQSLLRVVFVVLTLPAACASGPRPEVLPLSRVEPRSRAYSGVVLEVVSPWGSRHRLWPEEVWQWRDARGHFHTVFSQRDHIANFSLDAAEGRAVYRHTAGPTEAPVEVVVQAFEDCVEIQHPVDNRSDLLVLGGTPCLQDGGSDPCRY